MDDQELLKVKKTSMCIRVSDEKVVARAVAAHACRLALVHVGFTAAAGDSVYTRARETTCKIKYSCNYLKMVN